MISTGSSGWSRRALLAALCMAAGTLVRGQNTRPKVTWHWHMHQPIYWNDQTRASATDRYEFAWESIVQTDGGSPYPANNLREIFGKDDRVAAYQWRTRDALASIGGAQPNSGASVSYSGALMENVSDLAAAGQLGYGGTAWRDSLEEGFGWKTSTGAPRLDLVNFSFHHGLLALLDPAIVDMEIKAFQEKVRAEFGPENISKGFFPTEMAFSVRLIPVLEANGIEWSIVSGHKVSRACPDYPYVKGTGGDICNAPNRADARNPAAGSFIERSAPDSRGRPRHANPMAYQPSWIRYIDPETGVVSSVIGVPSDQAMSYADGFGPIDASFLADLESANDPGQPSLVVLAHDGDNAYGGGYSYYSENVPGVANSAAAMGNEATSIQHYLNSFPPAEDRTYHVEDGGWINPDNDFGSPTFNQWNYPLITQNGFDPIGGWHNKPREMAVFHAALNRLLTAEQVSGLSRDIAEVVYPGATTNAVERGWHYLLGSLDSGNVYFGAALDQENKGAIGCNEVAEHVDPLLAGVANTVQDETPPTIWLPQRYPYNPGGFNTGPAHNYLDVFDDGDFAVWTFVTDVSDVASAVLKYRIDGDGTIGLSDTANHLYAGGAGVGEWVDLPMNGRPFPKDEPFDFGDVDYFELPLHIADHYSVEIAGLRETLIDYYVEATDSQGNVAKSPIQHVWIGDGQGSGGGGDAVMVEPDPPVRGETVMVTYDSEGRGLSTASQVYLHHGFDGWETVLSPDPAMTDEGEGLWSYAFTVDPCAGQLDFAFNDGAGNWDSNGGADWHFAATGPVASECEDPPPTDAVTVAPDPPVRGQSVAVTYDAAGRALQGAQDVRIHYGIDDWQPAAITDPQNAAPMTELETDVWRFEFMVPSGAGQIDMVFNNGAAPTVWDNNSENDWHFATTGPVEEVSDTWTIR